MDKFFQCDHSRALDDDPVNGLRFDVHIGHPKLRKFSDRENSMEPIINPSDDFNNASILRE